MTIHRRRVNRPVSAILAVVYQSYTQSFHCYEHFKFVRYYTRTAYSLAWLGELIELRKHTKKLIKNSSSEKSIGGHRSHSHSDRTHTHTEKRKRKKKRIISETMRNVNLDCDVLSRRC